MESNALCHFGIKGMKWGVRRYQNKDGSLTKAGEKRYYNKDGTLTKAGKKYYDKEMNNLKAEKKVLANKKRTQAKLDKLNAAKKKVEDEKASLEGKAKTSGKTDVDDNTSTSKKSTTKPLSEMTNEELASYRQRLQTEKDIYDLQTRIDQLNPKPEPAVGKFLKKAGPIVAKELWNGVAKPNLNKYLEETLGLKGAPDEIAALEKEAKKWKAKSDIARSKKNYGDDTEKHKKAEKRRKQEKEAEAEAEKRAKEAEKEAKKAEKQARKEEKRESYSGTVEGEGTSRYRKKEGPTVDGKYRDVKDSAATDMGRTYVDNLFLLEDRNRW